MTEQMLRRRLAVWQRRLRLQNWRITVSLGQIDAYGAVDYDAEAMTAHVTISDAIGDDGETEETLVHELLHLLLADWGEQWPRAQERAINLLADALCSAYRMR